MATEKLEKVFNLEYKKDTNERPVGSIPTREKWLEVHIVAPSQVKPKLNHLWFDLGFLLNFIKKEDFVKFCRIYL